MELLFLVIGVLGLIPVGYFVYARVIRRPHSIDFDFRNIGLVRVVSPREHRNEKLAFLVYSVAFTNRATSPITLKSIELQYLYAGQKRSSPLQDVPTGDVQGKASIALANPADRIIVAWSNLRDDMSSNRVLQQGEIVKGDAIFFLEVPVERIRKTTRFALVIRDYSGGQSKYKLRVTPTWYQAHDSGFSLVDAPVKEKGDELTWEGISVTPERPA